MRDLIEQQRVKTSHKTHFGRIKPWEAYKFKQQEDAGLLSLLTQQEIDSVQVVYFTQEAYQENNEDPERSEVETATERDENRSSVQNLQNSRQTKLN